MHVLHINSEKDVHQIDKFVKQGSDVFILVYMLNCGPCMATRPEWEKLEHVLKEQYEKNNNLVIIDVNKDFLPKIKTIGAIDGFPTIKYISKRGKIVEPYEESSVKNKDRSVNSFINWIESKINKVVSTTPTSTAHNVYRRIVNKKSSNKKSTNKKSSNKKSSNRKKTRKHRR